MIATTWHDCYIRTSCPPRDGARQSGWASPRVDSSGASVAPQVWSEIPASSLRDLDAAARFAGVSRRLLLAYCRAGFVSPHLPDGAGAVAFTGAAIQTVRRLEQLRVLHGLALSSLTTLFALLDEADSIRTDMHPARND
jgi:hypothetical protein